MQEPGEISARRLDQLKSMAETRIETGDATTLENQIPGLATEIDSLRVRGEKMSAKIAAVIEDLHNISAQASGEHGAVGRMAASARQRLRGELGPGPEPEGDTPEPLERENEALRRALSEVMMDIGGRSLPVSEATRKQCEQALGYSFDIGANEWRPVERRSPEPAAHDPRKDPVIHLYPLSDEHSDATISANSAALRMLRDAIEGLLEDHGPLKSAGEVRVFASDGEGYGLSIEKREGAPHAALWEPLPEPYFVPRRRVREAGLDV